MKRGADPLEQGGSVSKGERTRAELLRVAFELFERDGFERTTLRKIAAEARVSLGLLYRYFPSKDALVIELYDELSRRFVEKTASLPPGPWAVRALYLVKVSLEVLAPHREALRAMIPSLTVPPGDPLFIPGGQPSQLRVEERFVAAAIGASDAPPNPRRWGEQLYLAHLGLVLAWLLDRSGGQSATFDALRMLERLAPLLSPLLATGALGGIAMPAGEILERAVLGKNKEEA
jgi:AcrR family transcriptional regulator